MSTIFLEVLNPSWVGVSKGVNLRKFAWEADSRLFFVWNFVLVKITESVIVPSGVKTFNQDGHHALASIRRACRGTKHLVDVQFKLVGLDCLALAAGDHHRGISKICTCFPRQQRYYIAVQPLCQQLFRIFQF